MAPGKPLAYQGVSSDIEKLKTRNVDLSGLLERPANAAHQNRDDSLERSYEFVRVARAALRSAANGEVDEAVNNISVPSRASIYVV